MVQLMPLHPRTPSYLSSFKSRLVLPFWYLLTQVVLAKKPLNGCSSGGGGRGRGRGRGGRGRGRGGGNSRATELF